MKPSSLRLLLTAAVLSFAGCNCLDSARFKSVDLREPVSDLACEDGWSCAVTETQELYCWGRYPYVLTDYPPRADEPVRLGGDGWVDVDGSNQHACAMKADGAIFCWGSNYNGQLGQGTFDAGRAVPTQVGVENDWTQVNASGNFTCGLRVPGSLWCWGGNDHGQLGLGTTSGLLEGVATPARVGADEDWARVAAGERHACAMKEDGRAFCWGSGSLGALGTGATEDASAPVAVAGGHVFVFLAAGSEATCGIDDANALWCWGNNFAGALPLGKDGLGSRLEPTCVEGDVTWSEVVLGSHAGCGLSQSGKLYCWNEESEDSRGGEREWTGGPQEASGEEGIVSICESGTHACIAKEDGDVECSGEDGEGQIGDGSSGGGGGD